MRFLLLLLLLSPTVQAGEKGFVFSCSYRTEIWLPVRDYPQGVPWTEREVCECAKRRWRGKLCDAKYMRERQQQQRVDEQYDRLADEVLGK